MPDWMKDWGQFIVLLLAMEERLGARIGANRAAINANREAIVENGKAIARLEVRMQRVEDDVTWLRNNR